ncbi:MAG TPA: regulatory protein RecX [Patescibacteria group bacterium]|nr:regulatory protein RecX [Patescibacteria group bacterium]
MDNPYYEKLINASLRFVSYRPRSEKEFTDFLTKKLAKWKVAGSVLIKKVIDRMRELGYVDDRVFASWWLDQRMTFKPAGRKFITFELIRKGISRDIIDEVFVQRNEEKDLFNEVDEAMKSIQKKIVLWAQMPAIEQKKKLYTFLAQRGFSSDTIGKIIDEVVKKDYN